MDGGATRASGPVAVFELDTPHGLTRAHLQSLPAPVGALMLGHGAGGSITASARTSRR